MKFYKNNCATLHNNKNGATLFVMQLKGMEFQPDFKVGSIDKT